MNLSIHDVKIGVFSFLLFITVVVGAQRARSSVCEGPPANPTVAENCFEGSPSTEWDVNGAGSDDIIGFSTAASIIPDQAIYFKIAIARVEPLRVDIYRLGWYNGKGARKMGQAELLPDAERVAATQPECSQTEPEAHFVDCGNWENVAIWHAPPEATSGLYFARLVLPTPQPWHWRGDASKVLYDPHHAEEGRDPKLPPAQGSHTYGTLGFYKRRNSLTEPRASHAWFVIRSSPVLKPKQQSRTGANHSHRHDLVFQTSDTTWHAYNGFGGLTMYGSFEYPREHAPNRTMMDVYTPGHDLKRAHKRSYNTPLVTRDYRSINAPLGAEYPAIRFLERLGVDLHYISGADMAMPIRAADVLERSRAFLSVGHDEYWSYEQRSAVETARDRIPDGLHLNFWSGNEAYWAVRFEDSPFSTAHGKVEGEGGHLDEAAFMVAAAPRTMVCWKDTQSFVKLDPKEGAWTGTFRDARPLNPRGTMPENALTGTMFGVNAQRADPLVVDGQRFGAHRCWRGTRVAAISEYGVTVRHDDAYDSGYAEGLVVSSDFILGHEWDVDVDNGARPAGLQVLSETTVDDVQVIMDWGATFDTGTATHSLVLYHRRVAAPETTKSRSGAIVFGAGTVQWSWGLDGHHDINDPQRCNKYAIRVREHIRGPSRDLQQLTVNILADQGVKMPSLAAHFSDTLTLHPQSTDREPPIARVATASFLSENAHEMDVAVHDRSSTSTGQQGGVVVATGTTEDRGGGVVASVEISWINGEDGWHPGRLERVSATTTWTFRWGEKWQRMHGQLPSKETDTLVVRVRVVDDSGNSAVFRSDQPLGSRVNGAVVEPSDPEGELVAKCMEKEFDTAEENVTMRP